MTKIIINRVSEYSNKLRGIKILIDNKEIGKIKDGESKTISVEPGEHKLQAKLDWCYSNEITFNLNDGDIKRFNLNGTNPLLGLYYLTFARDKYLTLVEIE